MKLFSPMPRTDMQRWNRRQRKKLRLGEFQELGFTLSLIFVEPLDESRFDRFVDAMIEAIESLGLCVGGLGGAFPIAETDGFVVTFRRGSVSAEEQSQLLDWLQARPELKAANASELVDVWHGWENA